MPRINLHLLRKYLLIVFAVVILFGGGYFLGSQGYSLNITSLNKVSVDRTTPVDRRIDFALFWKVWDTLSSKYFDKGKLDPKNMIYGAIQGMVSGVGDPYTVFLPPEESKVVSEDLSGSFEGVGIEIGYRGNQLVVISPIAGTPGEKAGVKPGDMILRIKDEKREIDKGTSGMSTNEAVQIIRGKAGTTVVLTLMREGNESPFEVSIVREKIDVPSVKLEYVGDNSSVAHVRILKFGAETEEEWNKAVREIIKKQEVKAMILDVRGNPGGYLQAAVDISAEFVKTGSVGVIEERGDGTRTEFKTERLGLLNNFPTVVLINGGSASASEILAGALRDLKEFKLVGQKSFGKGTIQEPINMDNGTRLHITIAKWLTPKGTWVHEQGLKPDIEVEDNQETPEDEQLQKAIEVLKD